MTTTFQDLNALSQQDFAALTPAQIAQLTPAQLAALDLTHCAWLSSAQTAALSGAQVSAMTGQQLAAVTTLSSLSLTAVAVLTPTQTARLTVRMNAYSGDWINALSPQAIAAIPPSVIEPLSTTAIRKLTPASAAALTAGQIKVMDYVSYLSPAAVGVLSPAQAQCFLPWELDRMGLGNLTSTALAAIAPSVIGKLAASTTPTLTAAVISAMTPQQIAVLPAIGTLTPSAVAALSPAQVNALPSGLATVGADWINALSHDTLAALPASVIGTIPSAAISGLSVSTVSSMSAGQLTAMTSPELLSADAAAARTAVLNPVDYATVTADWLNAQPVTAIAAISPADIAKLAVTTIQGISATTLRALSATQVGALTSPQSLALAVVPALTAAQTSAMRGDWNGITGAWVNALTPEARAALPTAVPAAMTNKEMWNLTAATVGTMTPAQVSAFRYMDWLTSSVVAVLSPDHIRALTPAQVGKIWYPQSLNAAAVGTLTPAQVAAIGTNWPNMSDTWMNALQPQSLAAIAPTNIALLRTSTVGALSVSSVTAMTNDQLAMLPSPELLTPAAAAVRNAALGPWLSVDWTTVTADWINGQSPAALARMPVSKLSTALVQGLSAGTITALSPRQIAGMPSLSSLSTAAVAALSPAQVAAVQTGWGTIGAAWLNALSPAACAALPIVAMNQLGKSAVGGLTAATVAALTPAQVAAITNLGSLYDGIKGLTAAQVSALTPDQVGSLGHIDWMSPSAASGLTAAQVPRVAVGWNWMSADWLNAMSPAALAAIPVSGIGVLTTSCVQGLTATTVKALTASQVAAITRLDKLSAAATQGLEADDVRALTPAQIASLAAPGALSATAVGALSAAQVSGINAAAWSSVGAPWFNALSADALASVPFNKLGAATVGGFDGSFVSRMTAQQFAALANPEWISRTAVGSLRPDQLCTTTDWDSVSASWLNALTPDAFAAIPAAGINQMSLAALQGLDATHRTIALRSANAIHAGYLGMASADASLNYDSVLAALQRMAPTIGANGLSADQFATFNGMLTSAKAAGGGTSYVSSLLTSMIKDGVSTQASAATFTAALNKWFLGTNNPTVGAGDGYIDVSSTPLFNGSIQQASLGVSQGYLGDCWLISPLEELAAVSPDRLSGLIGANGNGTYAVKFYSGSDAFFVTVDGTVANFGAETTGGSWVRLMEDAYVEAASSGYFVPNGHDQVANDYSFLSGGIAGKAQMSLTGNSYDRYSTGTEAYDVVAAALKDGSSLVTYGSTTKNSTGSDGRTNLVEHHVFAVLGVDDVNKAFILRNPWSSDLQFELTPAQLDAIDGTGTFRVTKMQAEYGSGTVPATSAPLVRTDTATAMAQADTASLLQAMSSFDVPASVTTSVMNGDRTRQAQVALLTPH